jgi:hypothetical protein
MRLLRLGNMAKGALLAAGSLLFCAAFGQSLPDRVLLVPLDDRPAASQMPAMLGAIAGVQVDTPPRSMLGFFDQPGSPEDILAWLRTPGRLAQYDAVILSTDMMAFGGLIASRSSSTPYELARRRLYALWSLRQTVPDVPFYAFSSVMRLAPTATRETAAWRLLLARHAEVKAQHRLRPTAATRSSLRDLESRLPLWEIDRYEFSRQRNLQLSKDLVQMTGLGVFEATAFGQDDASPMGPHLTEVAEILKLAQETGAGSKVAFLQGIDQVASVLLARAIVEKAKLKLVLRPEFSDPLASSRIAAYESVPISESFRRQVETAGGQVGTTWSHVVLAINTPGSTAEQVTSLFARIDRIGQMGRPVALADINLGKTGTPDDRLIGHLTRPGELMKLIGFAGWNTAANTMGTVVPAAMIHEAAIRMNVNPMERSLKLRTFLLHRFISDWHYHRFTRPLAYQMIDQTPGATREELEPLQWQAVTSLVQTDLAARAQESFQRLLSGTTIKADERAYQITGLEDLTIRLPWPRAYEVEVDFKLAVTEQEP